MKKEVSLHFVVISWIVGVLLSYYGGKSLSSTSDDVDLTLTSTSFWLSFSSWRTSSLDHGHYGHVDGIVGKSSNLAGNVDTSGLSKPEVEEIVQPAKGENIHHLGAITTNDTRGRLDSSLANRQGKEKGKPIFDGEGGECANNKNNYDDDMAAVAAAVDAEMLVHPALLVHPNPKRVVIILVTDDDDEGRSAGTHRNTISPSAVIREVLKHASVESVWILLNKDSYDDDAAAAAAADDDDDDDEKVKIFFENDMDSFYQSLSSTGGEAPIDVLLYDDSSKILNEPIKEYNPEDESEEEGIEEWKYWNYLQQQKFGNIPNEQNQDDEDDDDKAKVVLPEDVHRHFLLSKNGIVISYLGKNYIQHSIRRNSFIDAGFLRILDYDLPARRRHHRHDHHHSWASSSSSSSFPEEDACCNYGHDDLNSEPLLPYVVAFNNETMASRWHMTEAQWNLEITTRLVQQTAKINNGNDDSHKLILINFDGATMLQFEYPSRRRVDEFCRYNKRERQQEDACLEYLYDQSSRMEMPIDILTVRQSMQGDHSGRGVFTTVPVPAGTTIGRRETVFAVTSHWKTFDIINDMSTNFELYGDAADWVLHYYLDGYGLVVEPWGRPSNWVDSGILAFINHGCNGTNNVGEEFLFTETTIELDESAEYPTLDLEKTLQKSAMSSSSYKNWLVGSDFRVYNPLGERTSWREGLTKGYFTTTIQDLQPDDEILDNYIGFGGYKYLNSSVISLRDECMGGFGTIEEYQNEKGGK